MSEERWLDIPGYEGRYKVSSNGRVSSLKSGGKMLSVGFHSFGYPMVCLFGGNPLKKKSVCIHVLVTLAFIGPRPTGQQVRHLDGVKTNNRLENLAYGTPSENVQDSIRHGTCHGSGANGMRIWTAKLQDVQVAEMILLGQSGYSMQRLAKMFNVSDRHVLDIVSRKKRRAIPQSAFDAARAIIDAAREAESKESKA